MGGNDFCCGGLRGRGAACLEGSRENNSISCQSDFGGPCLREEDCENGFVCSQIDRICIRQ
jgi:hypothetical protein